MIKKLRVRFKGDGAPDCVSFRASAILWEAAVRVLTLLVLFLSVFTGSFYTVFAEPMEAPAIKAAVEGAEYRQEDQEERGYTLSYQLKARYYKEAFSAENGGICGGWGRSIEVSGMSASLLLPDGQAGRLEYRCCFRGRGWDQDWLTGGEISGNPEGSGCLEAIQLRLYGSLSRQYDVCYRVLVSGLGWLDWASNGAPAGAAGYGKLYHVEAIRILLNDKGNPLPGQGGISFYGNESSPPDDFAALLERAEAERRAASAGIANGRLAAMAGETAYQAVIAQAAWEAENDRFIGEAIAEMSCQYINHRVPYILGGEDLNSGVDCAGFVKELYHAFGVDFERNGDLYAVMGVYVPPDPACMLPGDIILYTEINNVPGTGHTGMYIGNGLGISASGPGEDVVIRNFNYRPILVVRRVFAYSGS
ncbi:MAG: C40 family peptidase [Lachnospiraceae bacterium]|nr:C40 family peptidase [Lachnospiraceae bacterium]